MSDPIGGWLLPVSMFGLMFGMGLALVPDDFRRIAKVPGPVVAGTLLQLLGMPLIGFGLALAYELPPLLAAGLVILAACPGGMMSNMLVHIGRANTALSITLTATATTATLFTLPLWIRAILDRVGGEAGAIDIPLLETAGQLAGLTILPVAIGMFVRALHPPALRLERPLSAIAGVGILAAVVYSTAARPEPPAAEFAASILPALSLAAAALIFGLGVPRLFGQSDGDALAIAVELCVKNGLLGMVVASSSFGVLDPSIPILVYTSVMVPVAIALIVAHRIRSHRRGGF